ILRGYDPRFMRNGEFLENGDRVLHDVPVAGRAHDDAHHGRTAGGGITCCRSVDVRAHDLPRTASKERPRPWSVSRSVARALHGTWRPSFRGRLPADAAQAASCSRVVFRASRARTACRTTAG